MLPPPIEKQLEILKQFRAQLEQEDLIHEGDTIGTDDATLLRFLRARQFDIKAAKTMWANCQHWRKTVKDIGIDELYRRLDPWDYPERPAVFDCWPLWFHKTDKKGRPLNIHRFGGINMPKLYENVSPERFWETIVVNAESLTHEVLPAAARAAGRNIDGTFVIVDLKGFGISQFWQMKNLARDSFQISQDYFPETMAQLAIINAPAGFATIWSFIKPWLAKETLAKIDILGSDYEEVLLRQIDAENLPTSLGGKCTCEESGGCLLSNAGPWMEGRKERREKWLRGERRNIGLGMEGEDEDDSKSLQEKAKGGGRSVAEGKQRKNAAGRQSSAGYVSEEGPNGEVVSQSESGENEVFVDAPEEFLQDELSPPQAPTDKQHLPSATAPASSGPPLSETDYASSGPQHLPLPPQPQSTAQSQASTSNALSDIYGRSTEVVDSQGDAHKATAPITSNSPFTQSPTSSPDSAGPRTPSGSSVSSGPLDFPSAGASAMSASGSVGSMGSVSRVEAEGEGTKRKKLRMPKVAFPGLNKAKSKSKSRDSSVASAFERLSHRGAASES